MSLCSFSRIEIASEKIKFLRTVWGSWNLYQKKLTFNSHCMYYIMLLIVIAVLVNYHHMFVSLCTE